MSPCFGARHCAIVQGFRLTLAPRSTAARRGNGRLIRRFPLWASADVRSFPEVTPPCACVHSPPDAACRPAKPRAWRLKTATTLPGGKAAVSLRLWRADSIYYRYGQCIPHTWTSHTTRMDSVCHPHGQRMPLICLLYTAHADSIYLICGQRMPHTWTVHAARSGQDSPLYSGQNTTFFSAF